MPREARVVESEHPYHVTFRGNNRRRLFSGPSDYHKFLRLLHSTMPDSQCDTHGFCLLPNHGHWLGVPNDEDALAGLFKPVLQQYAQYRNRTRNGSGKLFEERFYSKRIASDEHYAITHAYIDLNPVRAGIVTCPRDYKWSSYHFFAANGRPAWRYVAEGICTPSPWYLSLGETLEGRQRAYASWVDDCAKQERRPAHADQIERIERSSAPYTRRLERPDRTRAK